MYYYGSRLVEIFFLLFLSSFSKSEKSRNLLDFPLSEAEGKIKNYNFASDAQKRSFSLKTNSLEGKTISPFDFPSFISTSHDPPINFRALSSGKDLIEDDSCDSGFSLLDGVCTKCSISKYKPYYSERLKVCVTSCDSNEIYDSNNICIQCTEPESIVNKYSNACVSECPLGSVPVGNKCKKCSDNVDNNIIYDAKTKTCISSCNITMNIIYGDNICISCFEKNGTFYDLTTGKCLKKCSDTDIIDNYRCISCFEKGYYKKNNQCVESCDITDTIVNNECVKCNGFIQEDICVNECSEGYELVSDNICKKCPYFYDTTTKKCVESLKKGLVSQENLLVKCNAGEVIQNNKCVKKCSDDYIEKGGACFKCEKYTYSGSCVDDCSEIEGTSPVHVDENGNVCYTCGSYNLFEMPNGLCVTSCPKYCQPIGSLCICCDRFFDEHTDRCVENCSDDTYIDEEKKLCITCSDHNKYLFNGKCVDSCGKYLSVDESKKTCKSCPLTDLPYLENGKCISSCKLNSFPISSLNNYCYRCNDHSLYYDTKANQCLAECSSHSVKNVLGKSCTSCEEKYYFKDMNICIDDCVYSIDEEKKLCSFDTKCSSSGKKLNLYDDSCYLTCSKGYVESESMNHCVKCLDNSFKVPYYYNDKCYEICPDDAYENDDFTCSKCIAKYDNDCYEACPAYTSVKISDKSRCQICKGNFQGYDINTNSCQTCEKVINEVCVHECYEGLCLNGGACKNGECSCQNNYFGKFCQFKFENNEDKFYIQINDDNSLKIKKKNKFIINEKNLTDGGASNYNYTWRFFVDEEELQPQYFLTPNEGEFVVINSNAFKAGKKNYAKIKIVGNNSESEKRLDITPYSFALDIDEYDIAMNKKKKKLLVIHKGTSKLSLCKFRFLVPLGEKMIPLGQFSYSHYFDGYIPSFTNITLEIKDFNNEVYEVSKNISYINKDKLRNITKVLNDDSFQVHEKLVYFIFNIGTANSYDKKNLLQFTESVAANSEDFVLEIIFSSIEELIKSEKVKMRRTTEKETNSLESDILSLLNLISAKITSESAVELFSAVNSFVSLFSHSNSLDYSVIYNLMTIAALAIETTPGELTEIVSSASKIFHYNLSSKSKNDIIIPQTNYETKTSILSIPFISQPTNSKFSSCLKAEFCLESIKLSHLQNVYLPLYGVDSTLDDVKFIFIKLNISEGVPDIPTDSIAQYFLYINNEESYLPYRHYLSFLSNVDLSEFAKNIACVTFPKKNATDCFTYFNYKENSIHCICTNSPALPVLDENLAIISIDNQYPMEKVSVFSPFIISSIYCALGVILFYSITLLIIDLREDKVQLLFNDMPLKEKISLDLGNLNLRTINRLSSSNKFILTWYVTKYFYPVTSIYKTYHFNQPRINRFLYYCMKCIMTLIATVTFFYFVPLEIQKNFKRERNISSINSDISNAPIKPIYYGISTGVFFIANYLVGSFLWIFAKLIKFDYSSINVWKRCYEDLVNIVHNLVDEVPYYTKNQKTILKRMLYFSKFITKYTTKKCKDDLFSGYLASDVDSPYRKYRKKQKNFFIEKKDSFGLNAVEEKEDEESEFERITLVLPISEEEKRLQMIRRVSLKYFPKKSQYEELHPTRSMTIAHFKNFSSFLSRISEKKKVQIYYGRSFSIFNIIPNKIMNSIIQKEKRRLCNFVFGVLVCFILLLGWIALLVFMFLKVIKKYGLFIIKLWYPHILFSYFIVSFVIHFFWNFLIVCCLANRKKKIDSIWIGEQYLYFFRVRLILSKYWEAIQNEITL